MDLQVVDSIMLEFEKLPHDGQVELFLEIRKRLMDQRAVRAQTHKAIIEDGEKNLESIRQGNEVMFTFPSNNQNNFSPTV